MKSTWPLPARAQNEATPSTPSTSGSRSSGVRPKMSMDSEHAMTVTSPMSLIWRSVSLQWTGLASDQAARTLAPSGPASVETPWSLVRACLRNASSAQYSRNRLTRLPMAAAPAAITVAAERLSSVPENRTRESVSCVASIPASSSVVTASVAPGGRRRGGRWTRRRGAQGPYPGGYGRPENRRGIHGRYEDAVRERGRPGSAGPPAEDRGPGRRHREDDRARTRLLRGRPAARGGRPRGRQGRPQAPRRPAPAVPGRPGNRPQRRL